MPRSSASLCIVGATHLDETARLTGTLHPAASNPVNWISSTIGGVASNTSRSASQWVPTSLIAALGDDTIGHNIRAHFLNTDIMANFSILAEHSTGRYSVLLDQQGELILGLATTDISEHLSWNRISDALASSTKPDLLAFDANLSATAIREMCAHKPSRLLAALAVSPIKSMRLTDQAKAIDLLFVNRAEAAMMTGLPRTTDAHKLSQALFDLEFHRHVVTDGSAPVLVRDSHNTVKEVPVRQSNTEIQQNSASVIGASVNGAGDALAGATLAGILLGHTLHESVLEYGLPAAETVISGESPAPFL